MPFTSNRHELRFPQKLFVLATVLFSLSTGCRNSESPTNLPPETKQGLVVSDRVREFRRAFQEAFDKIEEKCPEPDAGSVHSRNVREFVTLAYCSSRLYQITRDAKYLEQTRRTFQAVLRAWQRQPELMAKHSNPFFVAELFFQIEAFLKQHDRLRSTDLQTIREYVDQIKPTLTKEDNQALAYAVGLTYLMRHRPHHANANRWKASVESIWQRWYSYKHNIENATTYTAIGWNAVFAMASNLGRSDKLDLPEIRQIFDNCSELVTPVGAVPNWGDSYFAKSWTYWVLLLENAC
ncbi:MAG: hypothetical protein IH991_20115, partial [Planctomycetes bacterium]|nr:hypothetical protein [Planctomycetota bacterium]